MYKWNLIKVRKSSEVQGLKNETDFIIRDQVEEQRTKEAGEEESEVEEKPGKWILGGKLTEMVQERVRGEKVEVRNIENFSIKGSCQMGQYEWELFQHALCW